MKISYSYQGKQVTKSFQQNEIIIGRVSGAGVPDIDLFPDTTVSRRHSRLWLEDDRWWIEDLGSKFGTRVNGVKIEYGRQLNPGDFFEIGETRLVAELPQAAADPPTVAPPSTKIVKAIEASAPGGFPFRAGDAAPRNRLTLLFEFPLKLAGLTRLEEVLEAAMSQTMQMVTSAERGAVVLLDVEQDQWLIKARAGPGHLPINADLAHTALKEGRALSWNREPGQADNPAEGKSGLYAPLQCGAEKFGIICVDNTRYEESFGEEDLRVLMALANYTAVALMEHRRRNGLTHRNQLLERLLSNFSPATRQRLLDRGRGSHFQRNCEKAEVSVLHADLNGLTKACAALPCDDITDLLELYATAFAQIIFEHHGTVIRLAGDSLLAVFGAPDADPRHHENAALAARALIERTDQFNGPRIREGRPICCPRIGLDCGETFSGFIGNAERLEFAVVGQAVNRAADFGELARPGEIVLSPEFHQKVAGIASAEPVAAHPAADAKNCGYRLKTISPAIR